MNPLLNKAESESLYKSRWLSRRAGMLKILSSCIIISMALFIGINLSNGYYEPIPAQIGIFLGFALCLLTSHILPKSDIPAHILLVIAMVGIYFMSLAIQDAIRFMPWLALAMLFTLVAFERWTIATLWCSIITLTAVIALSQNTTAPYPNLYLNTVLSLSIIGVLCVLELRNRTQLSDKLSEKIIKSESLNTQLQGISGINLAFITGEDKAAIFDKILALTLDLTKSEYGFIGEVIRQADGTPYLKTMAITNIAWNEETRRLYTANAASGLEFKELDTLFGEVIKAEAAVITNKPSQHPKSDGIPPGHPPIDAFMGLPIFSGPNFMGVLGVANRTGGYDQAWIEALQPLLSASSTTITSVKEREARIKAETALAQAQRMEAMGQLTGGVAHDFNNILSIMMGTTELLELEISDTPEIQTKITNLKKTIDRATSLTQRLLAFSRQQPLQPQSTSIVSLFANFKELYVRTLGEDIELTFTTADDLWWTLIDKAELDHALLNLAINARDAMPKGGSLLFQAKNIIIEDFIADEQFDLSPGEYVEILVRDTGSGMTAAVKERIYEPFFTTKERSTGTGLGMSMVYGFVRQSGGYLTVESKPGQGTSIRLLLPRTLEPPLIESTATDTEVRCVKTARILVVEDDKDVRQIAVSVVQAQGYEAFEAEDGMQALELLTGDQAFDALFTDVMLPGGMTGADIAESALKLQPNIKVLYTSGYSKNVLISEGKLKKGVRLISKPYRFSELLKELSNMLGEKKSQ